MESSITKHTKDISDLFECIQRIEGELNDLKKTNTAFTQRLVSTDSEVQSLKSQKSQDHDKSYSMSLTVHNVPKLPNENLIDVVSKLMVGLGVPVDPGQIANCRRVNSSNQPQSSNSPMIIIKFVSIYHKNLVWRRYIADKSLTVKDVFPHLDIDSRIYMNLMLSPDKNQIKNEVMRRLIHPGLAKKFWIHKGKIHVTDPEEKPVVIAKIEDVKHLAESWATSGSH